MGSAIRNAKNVAYGETQRVIFITATSILVIVRAAVLFWRVIDVKKPTLGTNG